MSASILCRSKKNTPLGNRLIADDESRDTDKAVLDLPMGTFTKQEGHREKTIAASIDLSGSARARGPGMRTANFVVGFLVVCS